MLLTAAGTACRRSENVNTLYKRIDSSAPPFTAKEPLQYRATRITTSGADAATATSQQTGIARDGQRWRMDVTVGGETVTLLDLPEGRVLLSTQRAVYARLRPDQPSGLPTAEDAPLTPDLSPERLLNQQDWRPEYSKLRSEQFGGRAVTVYQVTLRSADGQTDSLLWIDDETGFPLKNEVTETAGGVRQPAVYATEIRDLTLGPPPPGTLEVPANFREISSAEFWSLLSLGK